MPRKSRLAIILGSLTITVTGLLSILWALSTLAAPSANVLGVLETHPSVISPDNRLATADRTITVTLIDPDSNRPLFVGTGPTGELATFDQIPDPNNPGLGTPPAGNGERIEVPIDTVGTFIATLVANPIVVVGADGFTPLADRNGDGAITVADLEIVIPTTGTQVVAGDVQIVGIFSAERGLITVQVNRGGLNGEFFDLRYATGGQELARAPRIFTEVLAVPDTGLTGGDTSTGADLMAGEAFTLELNMVWLPLQDTNGDGIVSAADITIAVPGRTAANTPVVSSIGDTAFLANLHNGLAAGNEIALEHRGDPLAPGTEIRVTYLGLEDLVTVKGLNDVEIPLRLGETGADTGVFETTVIVVDGSGGQPDHPNPAGLSQPANLDPSVTEPEARPRIAAVHGGSITATYRDREPATTVISQVQEPVP